MKLVAVGRAKSARVVFCRVCARCLAGHSSPWLATNQRPPDYFVTLPQKNPRLGHRHAENMPYPTTQWQPQQTTRALPRLTAPPMALPRLAPQNRPAWPSPSTRRTRARRQSLRGQARTKSYQRPFCCPTAIPMCVLHISTRTRSCESTA